MLSSWSRESAAIKPAAAHRNIRLNDRERMILSAIVHHYILNADPLGSRVLARRLGWAFSPATIRNIMADLEEMGLLTHPYPSAGRIPTTLGYRVYVDEVMQAEELSEEEKKMIQTQLESISPQVEDLMDQVSSLLAEASRLLGFILSPDLSAGVLEKVEMVKVAEGRIMVVIVVRSGLVRSIMLELNTPVSEEEMAQATRLVNQRLSGLRLAEIPSRVQERLRSDIGASNAIVRMIMDFPEKIFAPEQWGEIHIGPTSHIIHQPEFSQPEKIKGIIELLDNKDIIVHLVKDQREGIRITIGEENPREELKDFSIITSTYRIKDESGTLGIIGPTRMNYARLISLVNYTAQVLSRHISGAYCETS